MAAWVTWGTKNVVGRRPSVVGQKQEPCGRTFLSDQAPAKAGAFCFHKSRRDGCPHPSGPSANLGDMSCATDTTWLAHVRDSLCYSLAAGTLLPNKLCPGGHHGLLRVLRSRSWELEFLSKVWGQSSCCAGWRRDCGCITHRRSRGKCCRSSLLSSGLDHGDHLPPD